MLPLYYNIYYRHKITIVLEIVILLHTAGQYNGYLRKFPLYFTYKRSYK